MLERLQGRTHEVWTGIGVVRDDDQRTAAECARCSSRSSAALSWKPTSRAESRSTRRAYGIQGSGDSFVRRLEGDYTTIVGLPLARLRMVLAEFT